MENVVVKVQYRTFAPPWCSVKEEKYERMVLILTDWSKQSDRISKSVTSLLILLQDKLLMHFHRRLVLTKNSFIFSEKK